MLRSTEAQWAELALNERRLLEELVQFQAGLARYGAKNCGSVACVCPAGPTLLFPQAAFVCASCWTSTSGACAAWDNAKACRPAWAFHLTAEMLLLQHSCLWFLPTQNRASAHLLLRHQTSYALKWCSPFHYQPAKLIASWSGVGSETHV